MGDLLLTNNKLSITKNGDIDIVGGIQERIQVAANNLQLKYNENEFAEGTGNMVFTRRLKMTAADIEKVRYDCVNAIMNDSEVKYVKDLIVTIRDHYTCSIRYSIELHDGTVVNDAVILNIRG